MFHAFAFAFVPKGTMRISQASKKTITATYKEFSWDLY